VQSQLSGLQGCAETVEQSAALRQLAEALPTFSERCGRNPFLMDRNAQLPEASSDIWMHLKRVVEHEAFPIIRALAVVQNLATWSPWLREVLTARWFPVQSLGAMATSEHLWASAEVLCRQRKLPYLSWQLGTRSAEFKGLTMTMPVRVSVCGSAPEMSYSSEFAFELPAKTATLSDVFDSWRAMVEELTCRFEGLDSGQGKWITEAWPSSAEFAARTTAKAVRAAISPDLANALTTLARENPDALLEALRE
jgi:hypothetical protein